MAIEQITPNDLRNFEEDTTRNRCNFIVRANFAHNPSHFARFDAPHIEKLDKGIKYLIFNHNAIKRHYKTVRAGETGCLVGVAQHDDEDLKRYKDINSWWNRKVTFPFCFLNGSVRYLKITWKDVMQVHYENPLHGVVRGDKLIKPYFIKGYRTRSRAIFLDEMFSFTRITPEKSN